VKKTNSEFLGLVSFFHLSNSDLRRVVIATVRRPAGVFEAITVIMPRSKSTFRHFRGSGLVRRRLKSNCLENQASSFGHILRCFSSDQASSLRLRCRAPVLRPKHEAHDLYRWC